MVAARGRSTGLNGCRCRDQPVEAVMNQHAVVTKFSHVKPEDTDYTGGGLREFFLYRDLGIADATGGPVICPLLKANPHCPPVGGTRWHPPHSRFPNLI